MSLKRAYNRWHSYVGRGSIRPALVVLFAVLSTLCPALQPSAKAPPETDSARLARIIDEYWHYPLIGTFYARYLAGETVDLPDISEQKANSDDSGPMPLEALEQHVQWCIEQAKRETPAQ